MKILTILLCLFLSVNVLAQSADTTRQQIANNIKLQDSTLHPEKMLIVIDGIIYDGGLSKVDPNSIASINILKKPGATNIYGPEGANGVLLITTKKTKLNPDTSMVIRDMPSVPASTKPLFVVDGYILKKSLKTINPKDIESITILKGASAIALYGTAATNGAVLITMKQSWRIAHKQPLPPKPLILVDGVIFKGDIRTIDRQTIASESILPKTQAIPIYGHAGENGALIITTKNAAKGFKTDTIR